MNQIRRSIFSAGLGALLVLLLPGGPFARAQEFVAASSSVSVPSEPAKERPRLSPASGFAILRARSALEDPACRRIFLDFQDSAGRTLQQRLDSLGWSAQQYLDWMLFCDSEEPRNCRDPRTLAMTVPGGRTVFLCAAKLSNLIRREPSALWVTVLHEELHSLGLGENPPASEEISRKIAQRCH